MSAPSDPSGIRKGILEALAQIAPESDLGALDPRADLRDQLDVDSMDLLNLAIALEKRFAVRIPDADFQRLRTIDDLAAYLERR